MLERLQGLERLQDLEGEYDAVEAQLADPAVLADPDQLRDVVAAAQGADAAGRAAYRRYVARQADLDAAHELLPEAIGEERELLRAEAHAAEEELEQLQDELKELLIPADPNDGKNVIVEIRGAEGGEEANLFARDLFQMYQAYAGRMGWPVEVLSTDLSDLGGINQVTFLVKGDERVEPPQVRGRAAPRAAGPGHGEPGPHPHVVGDGHGAAGGRGGRRRDRPATTSQIDVYRSSGPGGQGVNTTDSAVRITHKPTGLDRRHAGRAQPAAEPGPGA